MNAPELLKITAIAGVCHEANRAYCEALGDYSQAPWVCAPKWAVDSAVKGVMSAMEGATPGESHECWLAEKEAGGWVYGVEKDEREKTHPCMVPYEELPQYQKAKDRIFVSIVAAITFED